jgi:hypothetical protein
MVEEKEIRIEEPASGPEEPAGDRGASPELETENGDHVADDLPRLNQLIMVLLLLVLAIYGIWKLYGPLLIAMFDKAGRFFIDMLPPGIMK